MINIINWIKNNPLLSKDKVAGYGAVLFALLTALLANADAIGLSTTFTGSITTLLSMYKILTSENIRTYWKEQVQENDEVVYSKETGSIPLNPEYTLDLEDDDDIKTPLEETDEGA